VTRADSAIVGPQTFRVTVQDGATPVKGALVCLMKAAETYARGWTNSQGWVDLLVTPTSPGNLNLSVTGQDCYPFQAVVPVSGSANQPALIFGGLRIDDSDGNGRLDPGETADVYVALTNAGNSAASDVNARLRTFCPFLPFSDSLSSYGTIAAGATVEGDRFRATASGSTPTGTVAELIAACTATQGNWEPFFTTMIGAPPPPKRLWLDHDTGNMILSVTALGSIGTLGPYKEGSGLKYPRDAGYGSLYFTSFACGNGPSYVVDRWYGQPSSTFNTDWRAIDTLHPVLPPIAAHEEYQAVIDDGAHPSSKGLKVTQWSAALAEPGYDDFVIITYTIENTGANPINGLFAAIFSDFDINNTTNNNVYSDMNRRFTYMTPSSGYSNSAGIKLLAPTTAANQSAIDHAIYVTPGGMMTEAVKDSFLRGTISLPNSNRSANWSCVVSAGPFNLAPGARTRVAFALVGGNSPAELLAHADSAQSWFDHRMPTGISYLKSIVDDAPPGGNGDGIINPGESINLPLWVVNRSDRGTTGVWGTLRKTSADTLLTVTDSVRYFGTVMAGDSAFTGLNGFKFRVASACTNRYPLPLVLVCQDTLDSTWTSSTGLVVGALQLVPSGVLCWDPRPGGNNNGKLDPGENAELALGLTNIGLGNCPNVVAILKSGDSRLTVLDSTGTYGNVPHDSTVFNSADRYRVLASAAIPPETNIPCTLRITGTGYQTTRGVLVAVGERTAVDPIPDGPRTPPRYYAYDNIDSFYVACPEYDWFEIRGLGTRLSLSDDETRVISLPSGFGPWVYYGQRYDQLSICGNGWIAPDSSTSSSWSNTQLPSSSAPMMVAANWDDLYPPSGGGVWYYHDTAGHRFVVEWDSIPYYSQRTTFDWFEIILYDTTNLGMSGDNKVLVQYQTANGYSSNTVGLQDPTCTIGIQCLYNGTYHRAAAPLVSGRAILYTTDSVVTPVEELALGQNLRLDLRPMPNPVRAGAVVRFSLPAPGQTRLVVLDVTGRVVRTLFAAQAGPGSYSVNWDRKDNNGHSVAAGVYLFRLEIERCQSTGTIDRVQLCRKVVVVR